MDSIVPTPRFVTCIKHDMQFGNTKEYIWDRDKISVNPTFADDTLMLQNVFEAKIISSTIYPLVFESKSQCNKEITLRSLEFYREVQQDHNLYQKLSSEGKTHFLIGLRDMFVASCRNLLNEEEKQLLKNIVDLVDPFENDHDIVTKKILNLQVTPYPTSSHKMVKFLDISTQETLLDECFIRNELNLLIAFVDPRDLSYQNFENIMNLNPLFDQNFDRFKITNLQAFKGHDIFTFDMIDKSGILKALDKYGLYVQPLNKVSRGGERFIFSSDTLSKNLSESIVQYMKHPKLTNSKFCFVNYVFRYNKFRPGDKKFTSHYDTPYHDPSRKHHSKYTLLLYLTSGSADPVLSFGNGQVKVKSVNTKGEIKGIIFDQKYKHEGKAYLEGDKIFIRSELIYEYDDNDFTVDNKVSRMFNIGCYMTKQSLFNPQLDQYASDMFNQAAKARVSLAKTFNIKEMLLYKKVNCVPFVTNGYDYWFKNDISLKSAARLAIMDYFNCKLDRNKAFNKVTSQEIVRTELADAEQIFSFLENHQKKQVPIKRAKTLIQENIPYKPKEPKIQDMNTKRSLPLTGDILAKQEKEEDRNENQQVIDPEENATIVEPEPTKKIKFAQTRLSEYDHFKHLRFPPFLEAQELDPVLAQDQDEEPDPEEEEEEDDDAEDENWYGREKHCCEKHNDPFDPFQCQDLIDFRKKLQATQTWKKKNLLKDYSMLILDKEVELPDENIIVNDSFISFNDTIPAFNFAASSYAFHREIEKENARDICWTYGDRKKIDFVGSREKTVKLYGKLPSIPYRVLDKGYHLRLEVFQNNLIRKAEDTLLGYFIAHDPSSLRSEKTSDVDESQNKEIFEENNFEEI